MSWRLTEGLYHKNVYDREQYLTVIFCEFIHCNHLRIKGVTNTNPLAYRTAIPITTVKIFITQGSGWHLQLNVSPIDLRSDNFLLNVIATLKDTK